MPSNSRIKSNTVEWAFIGTFMKKYEYFRRSGRISRSNFTFYILERFGKDMLFFKRAAFNILSQKQTCFHNRLQNSKSITVVELIKPKKIRELAIYLNILILVLDDF